MGAQPGHASCNQSWTAVDAPLVVHGAEADMLTNFCQFPLQGNYSGAVLALDFQFQEGASMLPACTNEQRYANIARSGAVAIISPQRGLPGSHYTSNDGTLGGSLESMQPAVPVIPNILLNDELYKLAISGPREAGESVLVLRLSCSEQPFRTLFEGAGMTSYSGRVCSALRVSIHLVRRQHVRDSARSQGARKIGSGLHCGEPGSAREHRLLHAGALRPVQLGKFFRFPVHAQHDPGCHRCARLVLFSLLCVPRPSIDPSHTPRSPKHEERNTVSQFQSVICCALILTALYFREHTIALRDVRRPRPVFATYKWVILVTFAVYLGFDGYRFFLALAGALQSVGVAAGGAFYAIGVAGTAVAFLYYTSMFLEHVRKMATSDIRASTGGNAGSSGKTSMQAFLSRMAFWLRCCSFGQLLFFVAVPLAASGQQFTYFGKIGLGIVSPLVRFPFLGSCTNKR